MRWDIFISHAWRDKSFVRELASKLQRSGLRVWYDEFTLQVGDSLRRSIDHGLAHSRFGLVVLSPRFFASEWTLKELDALVAREDGQHKVILPVWLDLDARDIREFSPLLADKLAVVAGADLDLVVTAVLKAVTSPSSANYEEHRTAQRVRRLMDEIEDNTAAAEDRVAAINALRRLGSAAAPAVLTLASRLDDPSEDVATTAAWALGAIGPAAHRAVPFLANTMVRASQRVCEPAAIAIGKLGEAAEGAIPSLVTALERDEDSVAVYAAEALGAIGSIALPSLIALLESRSVPNQTYRSLKRMGPGAAAAVPALRKALRRPDQSSRYADIAEILGNIGPQANEALPDLLWLLDGGSTAEKSPVAAAAHAIVLVGMDVDAAGEALSRALRNPANHKSIQSIVNAIARLGRVGVRLLAASLKDDVTALPAAVALGNMGEDVSEAVPALVKLIENRDTESNIYSTVLGVLSKIGPAAHIAVPRLVEDAKCGDILAIEALGKIDPPGATAVPVLRELLRKPEHEANTWVTVLRTLAKYGFAARDALFEIQLHLRDEQRNVREAAEQAADAVVQR